MIAEIAAAQTITYPVSGGPRVGRSYSSSAGCLMRARSAFVIGDSQRIESIQKRIGAVFDSGLPYGVTGFLKGAPELIITVDGNSSKLDRSIVSIVVPQTNTEEAVQAVSFKARLEVIQGELGLSITQIAQLFGVTRKAVYDWLDGSEPRVNIANRMELISSVINQNSAQLNLKRLKGVWLTAVNGRSFIDILSDESLDEASRLAEATGKLEELAPRLGQEAPKLSKTFLGSAHVSDIDRVADLG